MISISAGLEFQARVQSFPANLTVGVVGVRMLNNAGGIVVGRFTGGIFEDPMGSGSYVATLVAPVVEGQYSIMWDWGADPSQTAFEDLFVTASGASIRVDTTFIGEIPDDPHFDLPFRLNGTSFATVQQDTPEDIANCVECIIRTPLGARDDTENFGFDDQTFENQPLNIEKIKADIVVQEPRASIDIDQIVAELVNKLTIRVGG